MSKEVLSLSLRAGVLCHFTVLETSGFRVTLMGAGGLPDDLVGGHPWVSPSAWAGLLLGKHKIYFWVHLRPHIWSSLKSLRKPPQPQYM